MSNKLLLSCFSRDAFWEPDEQPSFSVNVLSSFSKQLGNISLFLHSLNASRASLILVQYFLELFPLASLIGLLLFISAFLHSLLYFARFRVFESMYLFWLGSCSTMEHPLMTFLYIQEGVHFFDWRLLPQIFICALAWYGCAFSS